MQESNQCLSFIFVLSLLTTAAASAFKSSHSPQLPADALALLAFKAKADLSNKLPFPAAAYFCRWQGVGCDRGRIVRFVIENVPLGGAVAPNTLTPLDQLRVLSLQNDSLTGPLPDLSPLLNLKSLFLRRNSFSGSLPPSIAFLRRLRTLDLSYNDLAGPLPQSLVSIQRLYSLRLERNRFNGTIPPFNQTSLQSFNVSGNSLSGAVPTTPALLRFGPSAFSRNPGLCGEIVRVECHPRQPFFDSSPADLPPPPTDARGLHARAEGAVRGVARPTTRKTVTAAAAAFVFGVFVLVTSLACLALAVRKQRRRRMSGSTAAAAMAEDTAAAAEAQAVMRMEAEDELGEKLKKVAQRQGVTTAAQVASSGSLVFCAGEAQVYSLEQLMKASAEMLGRGTVGTTYKAVLDNRLIVCVKRLDATKTAVTGREAFERHMESVGGLRHPNLVPLRAYFQAKEERLLIYDYQPNGSLWSLIHGSKSVRAKPLHWTSCLKIAEDVAQGLSYIHQAWQLVHGNLKSSNVLLGCDFEACLTDYCLAALAAPFAAATDINPSETIPYRAPETCRPGRPSCATSKSDVYAFGVLMMELLTGTHPSEHPHLTPGNMMGWVRSARRGGGGEEEDGKLEMVVEVALACRVASPEQRPTMWQVLKMIQEIKEAALMDDSELLGASTGVS